MSLNRSQLLALVMLALSLDACSSFPTQAYNKSANKNIHTIAIAPIGMPDKPQVIIVNAVGNSFGLVGGIVEATRAAAASNEAVAELSAGQLDYKSYLPQKIAESLKAAGFDVQTIPGNRPGSASTKFLTDLPGDKSSDAVLDVYVTFLGYAAADAKTPYHPTLHLEARLVDTKTNKILFCDQVYYNNYMPRAAKSAISIEPDPTSTFDDRAAMKLAAANVAAGLRVAIDADANELAKQLQ